MTDWREIAESYGWHGIGENNPLQSACEEIEKLREQLAAATKERDNWKGNFYRADARLLRILQSARDESDELIDRIVTLSEENSSLRESEASKIQLREALDLVSEMYALLSEVLAASLIMHPSSSCEACEPGNACEPEFICGEHSLQIKLERYLTAHRKRFGGKS